MEQARGLRLSGMFSIEGLIAVENIIIYRNWKKNRTNIDQPIQSNQKWKETQTKIALTWFFMS